MVAKGAGSTARSVGRARELEPGHRRDGIALALLGLAVVVAASSWFDAARPVGEWIDTFLRVLIGAAVVLVPIALAALGVGLMRSEPDPESRPRLILGSAMIVLPALGLWHLWSGSPQDPVGRQHAAGFFGFAIGGPLSDGLTAWIAAPLLLLGVLFGLLLVTGTTIREVPSTLRTMFSTRWRDEYDQYDEHDDETTGTPGPPRSPRTSPTATTTTRRATDRTWPRRGRRRLNSRSRYPRPPERRWTTTRSRTTHRPPPNRPPARARRSPSSRSSWTGWWRARTRFRR